MRGAQTSQRATTRSSPRPADSATDVADAFLHHAVWTRLVDECGWSSDEAERWHADVLARVLLEPER